MNCPKCGSAMGRVQLPAAGVEIDCCEAHGVWLDVGELQQIVQAQAQRGGGGRGAARQAPGIGTQLMGGVARGAAHGVGSGLASGLIRSLFR